MFAVLHNMTPTFVIDPDPEAYWGSIYDNWTGNGIQGNMVTDNADLGFGKQINIVMNFKKDISKNDFSFRCPVSLGKFIPIFRFFQNRSDKWSYMSSTCT